MKEIEREELQQYFDKGASDYRFSVSCIINSEYICDVAHFESPDVAKICVDALNGHFAREFPGTNFILDNAKEAHDLGELLEVIFSDGE